MRIQNLQFFDKNGYNLNFEFKNNADYIGKDQTVNYWWEGNVYLPKTSVGLYSNAEIYIMENVDGKMCFPTYDKYDLDDTLTFRWDPVNKFVDEFFMFTFDDEYELKDTSSLFYEKEDGPATDKIFVTQFDRYDVPLCPVGDESEPNYSRKVLPVHVAFSATPKFDATTYKRTLLIYYATHIIGRINFYAESVEEDERLKVINQNLGYNITPEDALIFKEADLKEYMPNFILLNEKRKELILEGQNIYPYVGSYKALINAIKFFGYDNLSIVEYWQAVTGDNIFQYFRTSKYSLKDHETIFVEGKEITLPNKNYRKTNRIALVYTINHPTTDLDEFELPYTKEDFDYTIEEAIIKLFALKKKLDKEFMPGSSKIVDVIGEASYFGLNCITNNVQYSSTEFFHGGKSLDIDVYPQKRVALTSDYGFESYLVKEGYTSASGIPVSTITEQVDMIKDIADMTIDDLESKDDILQPIEEIKLSQGEYVNAYKDYYRDLQLMLEKPVEDFELKKIYPDDNIPVSAKVVLKNTSFAEMTFNDFDMKFNDVTDGLTFGNVESFGYNEIEWNIIYSDDQKDDEDAVAGIEKEYPVKEWSYSVYGDINELETILVKLPYVGYYDVKMSITDKYNINSTKIVRKAIKVEPLSVDIRGFYYDARELPEELKYDTTPVEVDMDDFEQLEDLVQRKLREMTSWAVQEHLDQSDLNETMPNYEASGKLSHPGPYMMDNLNDYWYLADNLNFNIAKLLPNIDDARYIHSGVDVKPFTWILLGYDYCKVAGKQKPIWTLTNVDTGDVVTHEGFYLTVLLKKEGRYSVNLHFEDTNGNYYEDTRNIVVVDNNANYKLYHTIKSEYDAYVKDRMDALADVEAYMSELNWAGNAGEDE